jgi:hypothetical protein
MKEKRDMPVAELEAVLAQDAQLRYNRPDREDSEPGQVWANTGGLLAYRDINVAVDLLQKLSKV